VPPQPTVVITPACSCVCPRHHLDTSRRSVAQSTSAAVAKQLEWSLQREPGKDQLQRDACSCNRSIPGDRRDEHPTANNERFLRRSTTAITTSRDGCCRARDTHSQIIARQSDEPATRHVHAKRRVVRAAWTSERHSRPHPDDKVDDPAGQPVTSRHVREVRRTPSTDELAAESPPCCGVKSSHGGRDASVGASRQQSAADFASCTDQLTSNIYASLAAYQDVQENDVIDAVRGYLRRQPSPSTSRHRRPLTGRRPGSAADGDRSRTVQLRQGDVGPLSSLVVIRPAIPQPRTSRAN